MARAESPETFRERVTTHSMMTIVGVLWTLVVLMVALALTTRGKQITIGWWAVFPVGWVLVQYSPLTSHHRRAIMLGATLLGSALFIVGTWMAWPRYSRGFQVVVETVVVERGFQPFDLLLIATTLAGTFSTIIYRKATIAPWIVLATGLFLFVITVELGRVLGGGLWVLNWGFNITLGGTVGLVYAGLLGLSSLDAAGKKPFNGILE